MYGIGRIHQTHLMYGTQEMFGKHIVYDTYVMYGTLVRYGSHLMYGKHFVIGHQNGFDQRKYCSTSLHIVYHISEHKYMLGIMAYCTYTKVSAVQYQVKSSFEYYEIIFHS